MRQDALDHEGALKPGRALDAGFEHIGHTSTPDAFEQRVLAEWNRLGKRYTHGVTIDFSPKCRLPACSLAMATGRNPF